MHAETVVALVSTIVAAIIAIVVPWMTFRFALRQGREQWIREQRSRLYVDMLTEAQAEQEWLEYATADEEIKQAARDSGAYTDKRLPPLERARLGARGTIFASRTVNSLFNQLGAEGFKVMLSRADPEATRIVMRVRLGGIMDQLQAAVRRELGTDRVRLDDTPGAGSPRAGRNAGPYSPARAPGSAPAETDASEAPPEEPPASGDDSVA